MKEKNSLCPTGNGTFDAYSVEARYDYPEPIKVGEQTFTKEWKRVHFNEAAVGVPIGPRSNIHVLSLVGLTGYPAAQALRWWFHASIERGFGGLCMDTRIVKHKVSYSYQAERETEHHLIGGEDRSSILPDWGKGAEPSK